MCHRIDPLSDTKKQKAGDTGAVRMDVENNTDTGIDFLGKGQSIANNGIIIVSGPWYFSCLLSLDNLALSTSLILLTINTYTF